MKALVLGGRGVIGRAIVERLGETGCEVTAVGRQDFDLTNSGQISNFFGNTEANFDILIHSGGHNVPKTFDALNDDEIRRTLDANLFGFLDVARFCMPYWQRVKKGKIVVISSLYGFLGRRGRLPYVMSKHALNGAVKTLAIELAPIGVLVNSVSPGYIATSMTYRNNTAQDIEKLVAGIPVGRMGTPEEVAKAVEFLCSDLNTYINGHDLIIDGGFSAGGFQ
jgi:3-oxoacyl-[acyl-carrier protein] reductase